MRKSFEEYHKQNPHIWELFRKHTLSAIKSGFRTFGSKAIFEVIRYNESVKRGSSKFKIDNSYTPDYVDLFEKNYPNYKGFFKKRKRTIKNR